MPRPARTVTAEEAAGTLLWDSWTHKPTTVLVAHPAIQGRPIHIPVEGQGRDLYPRVDSDVLVRTEDSTEWWVLSLEELRRFYDPDPIPPPPSEKKGRKK